MNDTVIYLLTHLNHKKKSFATFFFHWILYTYIYNTCTQLYINILINILNATESSSKMYFSTCTHISRFLSWPSVPTATWKPTTDWLLQAPFYQSRIKAVGVQSREPDNTPLTGFYILQARSSWQWLTSLKSSEHQNRHLRTVLFIATRS